MNHRPRSTFWHTYTRDVKADDLQRLFTRDTKEAYRFLTRHVDLSELEGLPRHRRLARHARILFLAFTMKLSPARRVVYGASLAAAVLGLIKLFRGFGLVSVHVPLVNLVLTLPLVSPTFTDGASALVLALLLMNLLVLLEVADRLSLKNDLEIARDIQKAMLPAGLYAAPGVESMGLTRPANTVGGDLYDILPLPDGRVALALGDVSGKGSPAALLMALSLAMLRTLVDEGLGPAELATRLNVQVSRHAPSSRFITMFYGEFDPRTGEIVYVNAGHMPPLAVRANGALDRLTDGGIALGMFDSSTYTAGRTTLQTDDLLAVYSDGITEAENPTGRPFDEEGLASVLVAGRSLPIAALGAAVVSAVEQHTADKRFADDLTILLLRRSNVGAPAGV